MSSLCSPYAFLIPHNLPWIVLQDPDLAAAIADLERQLEAARERVKRLELILEICRDRLERGAPLSPGAPEQEDFGPETR